MAFIFKKQKKSNQKLTNRQQKLLIILFVAVVLFGAVIWAGWMTSQVNYVSSQTQVDKLRQMVLLSTGFSKVPIPVDAKTGDLYLAQERLYIPANKDEEMRLTYGYLPTDSGTNDYGNYDLSVSSDFVFTRSASRLYNVTNVDEFYKALPEFHACVRGVRLVENPTPQITNDTSLDLRETLAVGNGRTVYVYAEKACPQLDDVVYHLKNLKAY